MTDRMELLSCLPLQWTVGHSIEQRKIRSPSYGSLCCFPTKRSPASSSFGDPIIDANSAVQACPITAHCKTITSILFLSPHAPRSVFVSVAARYARQVPQVRGAQEGVNDRL
jgi:hypothetical protein